MNKENTLFAVVGLLLGLIIGFVFANNVNQKSQTVAATPAGAIKPNSQMPEGHPDISDPNAAASMPQVQAAVDKAKQSPDDFEAQIKAAEVNYQIERYDAAIEYLKQANK